MKLTTNSPERRQCWLWLFKQDWLPIKHTQPRLVCLPKVGEVLAYEIDWSQLHQAAMWQAASLLAKRFPLQYPSYEVARHYLSEDGRFVIASDDLAASVPERSPFFSIRTTLSFRRRKEWQHKTLVPST
jgi:hypothetical protein